MGSDRRGTALSPRPVIRLLIPAGAGAYASAMPRFVHRSEIQASAESVLQWHTRPGAFERLNPPWAPVRVIERTGGVTDGGRVVLRMRLGPATVRWVAQHRDYVPGEQFVDEQVEGPFKRWVHTHRVTPRGHDRCTLEDDIEYELPGGPAGWIAAVSGIETKLRRVFVYRHRVTAWDLAAHGRSPSPLTVAVSGSSGFVGSTLIALLTAGGHTARAIRRARQGLDLSPTSGADAVVHLAGENIADGRWTSAKKARILDSRANLTHRLCEHLARQYEATGRPGVLISASAVGYYGDRGDEPLTEDAPPGDGFLADVCRQWEAATAPAVEAGIRVVLARLGVVLSPEGGAMARMLPPFRLGGGGVMGSGAQYWPWLMRDDAAGMIYFAILTPELRGPANMVGPEPVTNRQFTKALGRSLGRPTVLPMPWAAARLVFGEMADELFFASAKAIPQKLIDTGYGFRYPQLEPALRQVLGREDTPP